MISPLGFIKPCNNWFGSQLYATLRLIRLKPILQAGCKTAAFLELKRHRYIAIILSKECVFDFIFVIFVPSILLCILSD